MTGAQYENLLILLREIRDELKAIREASEPVGVVMSDDFTEELQRFPLRRKA